MMAIAAATSGLRWRGGDDAYAVITTSGHEVELYGSGLYRHDTVFVAGGQRRTDAVILLIAVPLLLVLTSWYRRGSLRGAFTLMGVLASLLYVYASAALGTIAYNELFLVYVALFSICLFSLVLTVRSIDLRTAEDHLSPRIPARWPARFLAAAGTATLGVWLLEPVTSLISGEPPDRLDTYSTLVTSTLDIAIIVPLTFIAAMLIREQEFIGYLIAFPLLGIIVLLGPTLVAQTISQLLAGVDFTLGEVLGPIVGFGTLAVLATWVMVEIIRHVEDVPSST